MERRPLTVRQAQAYDLWLEGKSSRGIGDAMGISHVSALELVHKAARKLTAHEVSEDLDIYRKRMLDRLDQMMDALLPLALDGAVSAADRVVSIMAMEAKLLGLDAPQKVEHSGTIEHVTVVELDAEIGRLSEIIRAGNGHALPAGSPRVARPEVDATAAEGR